MARPRQRTQKSTKAATRVAANKSAAASVKSTSKFKCPECGQTFGGPAALGAHRNRAHGIAGTSNSSRSVRARRLATGTRGRRGRPAGTSGRESVNRNALLNTLFPQGIPPKEEVVRAVNAWLDDAERLARSR
jgi:uncharacterized C2H2 Zn-finger protein